jgi:hypothetical protein
MPTVVTVTVVQPDGSGLPVSRGLSTASMIRRVNRERSQQEQEHGGYCHLPIVMQSEHGCRSIHDDLPI